MKQDKKLYDSIKNGSYFKESLEWYNSRFLHPFSERSFLLVVSIISVLLVLFAAYNVSQMFPVVKKIPFVIKVDNSTENFTYLRELLEKDKSPQESVSKYLIIDYIKTREEYDLIKNTDKNYMKNKLKKVKNSSSKIVFNEYKNHLLNADIYNPNLNYISQPQIRKINIKGFTFTNIEYSSGQAKVSFTSSTHTSNSSEKNSWIATIDYRIRNIEEIAKTEIPIRFSVKKYKIVKND